MLRLFVILTIAECLIDMSLLRKFLIFPAELGEQNVDFDSKNTRVSVQDELLNLSTFENEDGSITVMNDISLLFNQQRLENRLTPDQLREYINRYTPNRSVYRNKMDDDMLLDTLKSRHIQSLSEIRSWAEYCMETFDDAVKKQLALQQQEEPTVDSQSQSDNG